MRERDACGIGFVANAEGTASRDIVETAIRSLCRVTHRGAVAADARTGDGAGLLLPIPARFFAREANDLGVNGSHEGRLGIVSVFDFEHISPHEIRRVVGTACRMEGIDVLGWRDVPVYPQALGDRARRLMPRIMHGFLSRTEDLTKEDAEHRAFRARKRAERTIEAEGLSLYFPSFSFYTINYKALVAADQLGEFYPDLSHPEFEAPFAVFHQRYSTNTEPTWERAQPFRMLCHNGEINTIAGNVNRMRSREGRLGKRSLLDEDVLRPVIDEAGSDSAMLDNAVELLVREGEEPGSGRDIRHALAMLVPAAWEGDPWLAEERLTQTMGEPKAEEVDELLERQVTHGYTREELTLILRPSAVNGKEPTFSMGDDTPLPPFSEHRRPLYSFFKQRFAQVTNPAIDHLRERYVMSLRTLLGPRDPLLWERPEGAALVEYDYFFLFRPPCGVILDAT